MNSNDLDNVILKCHLRDIMNAYNDGEGISGNQLSKLINERRSTLNELAGNYDMDSRRIPARLVAKLCVFFDVSTSDLFTVKYVNEK